METMACSNMADEGKKRTRNSARDKRVNREKVANTPWQTTLVLDSMAARFPYSQRSKDAPMDYQWTSRSPVKPVWAAGGDEPSTPRKRM